MKQQLSVYIDGVGTTPFGTSKENPEIRGKRIEDLVDTAVEEALNEGKITKKKDIDMVVVSSWLPEFLTGKGNIAVSIKDFLGFRDIPVTRIEGASASFHFALHQAEINILSGRYNNILVIGAEKMSGISERREITGAISKIIDRSEKASGATMPAMGALLCQLYFKHYGITEEQQQTFLTNTALYHTRRCNTNSLAQFKNKFFTKKDITAKYKDHLVSSPLARFHCASTCDGAVATVLTSKPTDIKLGGVGLATNTLALRNRTLEELSYSHATVKAADILYKLMGINPSMIEVAEIHNAFPFPNNVEDLGLCKSGEGINFNYNGENQYGTIVNPSGGLIKGHPIGATGGGQIVELVLQMRGEAGKFIYRGPWEHYSTKDKVGQDKIDKMDRNRQLKKNGNIWKPKLCIAQSIGAIGNGNGVVGLINSSFEYETSYNENWTEVDLNRASIIHNPPFNPGDVNNLEGVLEVATSLFATPSSFRDSDGGRTFEYGFGKSYDLGLVKVKLNRREHLIVAQTRIGESPKLGSTIKLEKDEKSDIIYYNRV